MNPWLSHDIKLTAASDPDLPRVDMNIKDCEGDTRHGWSNQRKNNPWLNQTRTNTNLKWTRHGVSSWNGAPTVNGGDKEDMPLHRRTGS